MKITVNQTSYDLSAKSLIELIEELQIKPKGTAIAVNDMVIPKSHWKSHQLSENDKITVIRATQGG